MKITLLTLLLPVAALVAAQGPDAGGYSATDAAVFSFVDISGGGGGTSILSGTDDAAVNVTLPFAFQFYGTGYTKVCVSSNGAAYFLSDPAVCATINDFANTDLSAGAPGADQAAIFPFWTDLTFQTPGAGSVFYQTLGVAPNRRFIIQWSNAYPQGSPNAVTFQAVLAETSNAVFFQYQTVSLGAGNPANNGAQSTIGIRNANAQTTGQQLQWAFNSAVVADSVALAFTKGAGPLPPVLIAPSNGNTSVVTPVTLSWTSSVGATSYDVYFGATNPPPLVTNVAGTSFSPPSVTNSSAYNWQVVAKNGAGSGASAIRSFTTAAAVTPPSGGTSPPSVGNPLSVSPETITLTAVAGGSPSKQTVKLSFQTYIQGAPAYSSNATTNQGAGWLSVTPSTGPTKEASFAGSLYTYTAEATINVDPTGLSAGASYTGNANFSAGGGIASVAVTMNVVSQPSELTPSQKSLTFIYRKGGAAPAAQNISLASKPTGAALTAAATTTTGGNWLSAASSVAATPATITVSANGAIIANLALGSYSGKVTISVNGAAPVEVPVTVVVIGADDPAVSPGGVVPVYSTSNTIQPGSWISIYGTKLATSTESWKGDFPTSLGGVSVTINGKPAFLWFVSPTQINLQAPDDTVTGPVNVVVTTPTGAFTSTVTLGAASPSLSLLDSTHVAAVALNPDGSYDTVGPTGAFTYPTRPVAPGEALILYGVGFGPTDPPVKSGQPVTTAAATVNPVTVTIGGVNAKVTYSGIVGAGLYQINVTVPSGIPSGDQPVRASVSGLQTGFGSVVTIR
jgi:uncharacterized protein (TIGR03437 family)